MNPLLKQSVLHSRYPEIEKELLSLCQGKEETEDINLQTFDYWLTIFTKSFVKYREAKYLAKIIYQVTHLRRELEWQLSEFHQKRHTTLILESTTVTFPFSQKKVLGIILGIYINPACEILNKEGISQAFNSTQVEGDFLEVFYSYSPTNSPLTLYYFEIGIDILKDLTLFKKNFSEEIEARIQPFAPLLFMTRNEEEVMRNLITLKGEFQSSTDLPQLILTYDHHDTESMTFSAIIVYTKKEKTDLIAPLKEAVFTDIRTHPLGKTQDGYPIEGKVFRITLTDIRPFQRKNCAIDFYQIRKYVCELLFTIFGECRDFNGGMISKQDERLVELKKLTGTHTEFLENFFYSLRPIERQATLPVDLMAAFFDLFTRLSKTTAVFDLFDQKILVAIKGELSRSTLQSFVEEKKEIFNTVAYSKWKQGKALFTGYILECPNTQLKSLLQEMKERIQSKDQKQPKPKILRLNNENEFIELELDPRIGGNHESSAINKLLFEGLTRLDPEGNSILASAESYQLSEDKCSYTFKLKELYWSNGIPLTAYDFEYAWKKILSPTFQTRFAYTFYIIRNAKAAKEGISPLEDVEVKAFDSKTLNVNLEYPAPYFLELTSLPLFSPVCRELDKQDPGWSTHCCEKFICNGPFKLKKPRPFYNYELEKNPYYWNKDRIAIDGVSISNVNLLKALEMFKNQELDWLGSPFIISKNIFSECEKETTTIGTSKVFWYCFNTAVFPLNRLNIRKAIFLSVDREKILQKIPGNQVPAYSPLPESHSQVPLPKKDLEEDRKRAYCLFCRELDELGISKQAFPPLTILYPDLELFAQISAMLKEQLENSLGIKCQLEATSHSSFFQRLALKDYQIGAMRWVAWLNDPIYTLEAFHNKEEQMNFTSLENTTYQALLDLSRKELNLQKRKQILAKAEKVLIESHSIFSLFYEDEKVLKQPNLIIPNKRLTGVMDFSYASFK